MPILRKAWSPVGERPVVPVCRKYEWFYLYGFVRPSTGETFWLILSSVDTVLFEYSLKEFAKHTGAGKDKKIILVLDGAGFHPEKTKVPEGIVLEFLPAYSPELQPAEKLWPITNEGVCNRVFASLDDMINEQSKRCQELINQKEQVKNRCLFHWWPED